MTAMVLTLRFTFNPSWFFGLHVRILQLSKFTPASVLLFLRGIGIFFAFEPEAVPVDIALHCSQPSLRMLWLVILVRVVVKLDGLIQPVQSREDLEALSQTKRWSSYIIIRPAVAHLLHQERSMNLVQIEGDRIIQPILQSGPIGWPAIGQVIRLYCISVVRKPIFPEAVLHVIGDGRRAVMNLRMGQNKFRIPSRSAEPDDAHLIAVNQTLLIKRFDSTVPEVHVERSLSNATYSLKARVSFGEIVLLSLCRTLRSNKA